MPMQSSVFAPDTVLVSVGMPVYNGENTIAAAIESVLQQNYVHLEILISDNASTDGTGAICQSYAQRDSRIRYIRQAINLGAAPNFLYVLKNARGPLFLWAAADDVRSPDFISVNATFLQHHPDYVASTSPVRFENGTEDPVGMGDRSLDQATSEERVLAFFTRWHANGRFYSLFRRDALILAKAFSGPGFLASDWALMLEMAKLGKFHRANLGHVILGIHGASHDAQMFRKFRTTWIEHLIPLWRFGGHVGSLAHDFRWGARAHLQLILLELNLRCWFERIRRWIRRPTR